MPCLGGFGHMWYTGDVVVSSNPCASAMPTIVVHPTIVFCFCDFGWFCHVGIWFV